MSAYSEYELRAGDGPRKAHARDLALATELRQPLEERLRAARGAHLNPDHSGTGADGHLGVRRAGGHLDRLPSGENVRAAAHPDLDRSGHDLEPLDLAAVHVPLREKAARTSGHLHLEQLAVGVRGRAQEPHRETQRLHLQHVVRHCVPPFEIVTSQLFGYS